MEHIHHHSGQVHKKCIDFSPTTCVVVLAHLPFDIGNKSFFSIIILKIPEFLVYIKDNK